MTMPTLTLPTQTFPSLFLAHGGPDLPLSTTPARAFTQGLAAHYPAALAILVILAHGEARQPTIGTAAAPETVPDFGGFDDRLYSMTYPARTSADLVAKVEQALTLAGIAHAPDATRGYDHGVWIALLLAIPKADLPVVQLSLRRGASPAQNFALGQALAPLRDQGVLIIGSGSTVHNLHAIAREGLTPPDWARAFDDWIVAGLEQGDVAGLVQFPAAPTTARKAHPTPEHLMPRYVAKGAGGGRGSVLHRGFSWGAIGMTSFSFYNPNTVTA